MFSTLLEKEVSIVPILKLSSADASIWESWESLSIVELVSFDSSHNIIAQTLHIMHGKEISFVWTTRVRIHQPFFRTFFVLFSRFFYMQIHLNETQLLIG